MNQFFFLICYLMGSFFDLWGDCTYHEVDCFSFIIAHRGTRCGHYYGCGCD